MQKDEQENNEEPNEKSESEDEFMVIKDYDVHPSSVA